MKFEWKFDHQSFAIGLLSMAALCALVIFVLIVPKIQSLDATWKEAFGIVVRDRNACQARFREVTVLYDFAPMKGLHVGPLALQPQTNGQLVGDVRPRWAIPARVRPTVYGELQNARYFYYNPETQEQEGPFVPIVSK